MLKLEQPVIIGERTYQYLLPLLGRWDSRTRQFEINLCLGTMDEHGVHVGTEELKATGEREFLLPEFSARVIIQDGFEEDAKIRRLFESLRPFFRLLEEWIIESQDEPGGIASQEYINGETRIRLKVSRASSQRRIVTTRKRRQQNT